MMKTIKFYLSYFSLFLFIILFSLGTGFVFSRLILYIFNFVDFYCGSSISLDPTLLFFSFVLFELTCVLTKFSYALAVLSAKLRIFGIDAVKLLKVDPDLLEKDKDIVLDMIVNDEFNK